MDFDAREFTKNFESAIRKALQAEINATIPRIRNDVGVVVTEAFKNSREYQSILQGKLKQELGLGEGGKNPGPSSQAVLDSVVNAAKSAIRCEYTLGEGYGGIYIGVFATDYNDLLSASLAQYISINSKGGSHNIPWLEWLLVRGDEVIVSGHQIMYSPSVEKWSRAGEAIMINKKEGNWKMPAEFSGTDSNNWVTRIIRSCEDQFYSVVEQNANRIAQNVRI